MVSPRVSSCPFCLCVPRNVSVLQLVSHPAGAHANGTCMIFDGSLARARDLQRRGAYLALRNRQIFPGKFCDISRSPRFRLRAAQERPDGFSLLLSSCIASERHFRGTVCYRGISFSFNEGKTNLPCSSKVRIPAFSVQQLFLFPFLLKDNKAVTLSVSRNKRELNNMYYSTPYNEVKRDEKCANGLTTNKYSIL